MAFCTVFTIFCLSVNKSTEMAEKGDEVGNRP
jgi:hypothetical protein